MATLTALADPPAFRITFAAADLNPSVSTVTLFRTADGQTNPVRTAIGLGAVGGFTAFDAEAPIGVPVEYQALQFNASGVQIGYAAALTGTLPADEPIYAWISDPLVETSPIRVVMTDTAGTTPSRTVPGTIYRIGATTAVLSGLQSGLTDLDMGFYTESPEDDAVIQAMIAHANGSLLIRTMPGFGVLIPRALYCFASQTNPVYQGAWQNKVSEISPTTQAIEQSKASWQDVIDNFATWNDVESHFGSWLDLEQAFDN